MNPGSVVVAHLHHDQITGGFAVSLDKLLAADDRVLYPPIRNQSNTDLGGGRNQCVTAFLDSTPGEWLLFIDDDMGFEADIVDKLLAAADPSTRPVVGGLCFAYRRYEITGTHAHRMIVRPTIYTLAATPTDIGFVPVEDYLRDGLVRCDGTGAAMLLLHRNVLERIRSVDGDEWFSTVTVPLPGGGSKHFSEDLSLMWRLAGLEIPVHICTAAKTHHRKTIDIDEWYYDNQPVSLAEPLIAVVGTGRSGSRYIADLLTSCGVNCGHEGWWNVHGTRAPALLADSSWVATAHLDDFTGAVWHQTRDPLKVMASLLDLYAEDAAPWVEQYEQERRKFVGYDPDDAPIVKALATVRAYWEEAERHADRTWRVEDITAGMLLDMCVDAGVNAPSLTWARSIIDKLGTDVNQHNTDGVEFGWGDVPNCDDKTTVMAMAARFGYET